MKSNFKTSKDLLLHDYQLKKKKNQRFSKRSYALHLGLSNGRLAEILSGKSPITEKRAQALVRKLLISNDEKKLFLKLVQNENQCRNDGRRKLRQPSAKRLQLEEFALIRDWEYFATMALIETSGFQSETDWIAEKLQISRTRCREVLQKLQSLDYVQTQADGTYKNNYHAMSTLTDIPSQILKDANKECILQGLEKMETVDVELREITSLTLPTDLGKLKAAKVLIHKFKEEMMLLCETKNATEVYNLNIQFVPVSKLNL